MGIGFVLLFWAVLFGVLGIPVAVGLGLWTWSNHRRARTNARIAKALAAAALPYVLLAYGGVAFLTYAAWCEAVRHVDAGIGDSWMVPIGNDHSFCMVDVPTHGYLLKGGCSGSPTVSGITDLTAVGDDLVGRSESSGAFIFDARSGSLRTFPTVEAAAGQFGSPPRLQSANTFYIQRRWGWPDLAALAILAVPVAVCLVAWYRWFIQAREPLRGP